MSQPQALVVEDNINLSKVFSEALRQAGYEVAVVLDGQAALDHLEKNTPYLILLDLHLPDISGVDVLRWTQAEARFADSHIFVASADGTLAIDTEIEQMATIVLQKPVRFAHLQLIASRFLPS
ncbi:MAG: response regulator [Chloroflexi bacterium]|nr:response regulator [Chloroflexota bacterium]